MPALKRRMIHENEITVLDDWLCQADVDTVKSHTQSHPVEFWIPPEFPVLCRFQPSTLNLFRIILTASEHPSLRAGIINDDTPAFEVQLRMAHPTLPSLTVPLALNN